MAESHWVEIKDSMLIYQNGAGIWKRKRQMCVGTAVKASWRRWGLSLIECSTEGEEGNAVRNTTSRVSEAGICISIQGEMRKQAEWYEGVSWTVAWNQVTDCR